MHRVITGANGFVGRALASRLSMEMSSADTLTLCDTRFDTVSGGTLGIRQIEGSLAEPSIVAEVIGDDVDTIFHLATVPSRAAEDDFYAGKTANLDGMIALLEGVRRRSPSCRFIFASSAAVYGAPVPSVVTDATCPNPMMSYAAHKLIGEILVNDYTRRGYVDGLSLRLSGILGRPVGSTANASAFLNDVIHAVRGHRPYTLPVGPHLTTWVMSLPMCLDNLLHAASISTADLPARRNWALPALHVRMDALVAALGKRFGADAAALIDYQPQSALEAFFHQPVMQAEGAVLLGFRADATIETFLDQVVRSLGA